MKRFIPILFLSTVLLLNAKTALAVSSDYMTTSVAPTDAMKASDEASTGGDAMMKVTESEYVLPYPGILPDNPLYFLKKLRDSILEMLIADPVRKVEFYVLQADKDLASSMMLQEKKNEELVGQTVASGQVSINKAVAQLSAMKQGGTQVPSYVVEHVEGSLAKRQQVLTMLAQTSNSQKDMLLKLVQEVGAKLKEVSAFK